MSSSSSPTSSSSPPPPPPLSLPPIPPPNNSILVISPCAACKILRRRCVDKCVLAPYFPPTDPLRFTTAHRIFGASNIIKNLQEIPESQRADAVSSMVYEANARIRDPVYGCAGTIWQLQRHVGELQAQLAKTQAELTTAKAQHANLVAMIMEMAQSQHVMPQQSFLADELDPRLFLSSGGYFMDDDYSQGSTWDEPLWT